MKMWNRYQISREEVVEMEKARQKSKNKNVDRRLKALILHAEGVKHDIIAEKTEFSKTYISKLVSKYREHGISAISDNHYEYFLRRYYQKYPNYTILLVVDGASWHTSSKLKIPKNIEFFKLPPAIPEMNPIEQIWKEIRKLGFRNEFFTTLDKVIDRLCDTICSLTNDTIKNITGRDWIIKCF